MKSFYLSIPIIHYPFLLIVAIILVKLILFIANGY